MPIKLIQSNSSVDIEKDDVQIRVPKIEDLWEIIKLVTMSKEYEKSDWQQVVRQSFCIFFNKTVTINGKKPTMREVDDWDADFFISLLITLFPHFKARFWPQLLQLLQSLGLTTEK